VFDRPLSGSGKTTGSAHLEARNCLSALKEQSFKVDSQ
jgi:hypothetical protein